MSNPHEHAARLAKVNAMLDTMDKVLGSPIETACFDEFAAIATEDQWREVARRAKLIDKDGRGKKSSEETLALLRERIAARERVMAGVEE